MKKSDLKNGMIVENREGTLYLVLENKIIGEKGYSVLDRSFNDDLTNITYKELDIVKVYRISSTAEIYTLRSILDAKLECIWERIEEVDWDSVTKWTKIKASDDGINWYKCYFLGYKPELADPVYCTRVGQFAFDGKYDGMHFKMAMLCEDEE